MKKLICSSGVVILLTIGGCDSSDDDKVNIDYSNLKTSQTTDSTLTTTSESRFANYIKNGLRLRLSGNNYPDPLMEASADSSGVSTSQFSTTNVHEIGVDEADRFKYDGEYLYAVESNSFSGQEQSGNRIRILQTDKQQATASLVAEIVIDSSEVTVSDLFLLPETKQLVSLANTQFNNWFSLLAENDWQWNSGKVQIQLFDIANPQIPFEQWKFEIEGNLEGSRRIGDTLYLVTRYIPNVASINYQATTNEEKVANEKAILSTPITELLPHFRANDGVIQPLVNAEQCLVSDNIENEEGYADVITLSAINLTSKQIESAICLNTNAQGIYSSTSGFYIGGSSIAPWFESSNLTAIHKFAIDQGVIAYRGSAAIPGYLGWQDPAFRMSEYNNDLRIVTTDWRSDGPSHKMFILREAGSDRLQTIATLPNASNPAAIGKPGEDIFAIRFSHERAYIVTFEQIDPLYIIDLTDPLQPNIESELEIPGFSRYLHPLSDDWLLAIGHETEGNNVKGIKLELIDIRNSALPVVQSKLVIGDSYSQSEALYDLRSISLLELENGNQKLALPINVWQEDETTQQSNWLESGLFLFNIETVADNEFSLSLTGKIIAESASNELQYPMASWLGRSKIHDDAIFYLHGNQIFTSLWTNLAEINGPY